MQTKEFSKMFDSERNKQHHNVSCNEIRRLPNEPIKQLAVRIKTLIKKHIHSIGMVNYRRKLQKF